MLYSTQLLTPDTFTLLLSFNENYFPGSMDKYSYKFVHELLTFAVTAKSHCPSVTTEQKLSNTLLVSLPEEE